MGPQSGSRMGEQFGGGGCGASMSSGPAIPIISQQLCQYLLLCWVWNQQTFRGPAGNAALSCQAMQGHCFPRLQIPPGQFVLFNGASFLADLSASGLQVRTSLQRGHKALSAQVGGKLTHAARCHISPPISTQPPRRTRCCVTSARNTAVPDGTSRLPPPSHGQLPDDRAAELLSAAHAHPLDILALRKYKGLVEQYGFAGGIYVQVGAVPL